MTSDDDDTSDSDDTSDGSEASEEDVGYDTAIVGEKGIGYAFKPVLTRRENVLHTLWAGAFADACCRHAFKCSQCVCMCACACVCMCVCCI